MLEADTSSNSCGAPRVFERGRGVLHGWPRFGPLPAGGAQVILQLRSSNTATVRDRAALLPRALFDCFSLRCAWLDLGALECVGEVGRTICCRLDVLHLGVAMTAACKDRWWQIQFRYTPHVLASSPPGEHGELRNCPMLAPGAEMLPNFDQDRPTIGPN